MADDTTQKPVETAEVRVFEPPAIVLRRRYQAEIAKKEQVYGVPLSYDQSVGPNT